MTEARVSRGRAAALTTGGLLAMAGACWAGARGIEPVATWLYPFAWYPLLLALEGVVALRRGRFLLLGRPRLLVSVLGWSTPVWMLWELLNFRLHDWYYVFVPDGRPALWAGVVASFATVLAVCFLPAAAVGWGRPRGDAEGAGDAGEASAAGEAGPAGSSSAGEAVSAPAPAASARRTIPRTGLLVLRWCGAAFLVLPFIWPRIFFPLVWGGFVLLLEPDLYRRAPSRSLLADVTTRRWRRIVALLVGGALAGLVWEAVNATARGGWIYTVPGFESWKVFEMPLPGFLGFPPLALSCFTLYQWLALRGWAVPLRLAPTPEAPEEEAGEGVERESGLPDVAAEPPGGPRVGGHAGRLGPPPAAGATAARFGAAALVVLTLLGMERWSISSRTPRLRDLPGLLPSNVEALRAWGVDSPFELADLGAPRLSERVPGVEVPEAERWVGAARLATLRGMGTRNSRFLWEVGIRSVEDLAEARPDSLAARLRALPGADVRPAQVRVWWRAARERAEGGEGSVPAAGH